MKNVITKLFLFAVGLLLSLNYVIFPGLTAANTFYNLGASFFAFGVGLYSYHFISNIFDYFTQKDTKGELDEGGLDSETIEKFQKLAGIKPHDTQKGTMDLVSLLEKADEITKNGFPPQSETIPVKSTPITKIQVSTTTNESLSEIPMSRVSNEAKQQMAEIAMADINKQLEEKTANIHPIHYEEMQKELEETDAIVTDKVVKPKRKYNRKPKTI